MLIKITEDYIKRGTRKFVESCPVAQAINDSLPPNQVCMASASVIIIYDIDKLTYRDDMSHKTVSKVFLTPSNVEDFIEGFDRGASVQPIQFELEI